MGKIDYYRNLAGFNILLMENGTFISDTLVSVFKSLDCRLVVANSALNGIKCLNEDCFDIVISDMALPGMDGLEFFKYVVSLCPQTLTVLIVGYGDIDPLSAAHGAGVDEIVEKPFPVTDLLDRIVGHFNEYVCKRPKNSI